MSQMVSDHVYSMEERGDRIERVVEIYESADAVTGYKLSREQEDAATTKNIQTQSTAGRRCFHWTAVCLILMSLLLLASVVTLGVRFNIQTTANHQLQTRYDNLTISRAQLQTCYDNLTKVADQLQTRYGNLTSHYTNLTTSRAQLQTSYDNLTTSRAQLQTSYDNLTSHYTNLTTSRAQLQTSYDNLTISRAQLQTSYDNLTSHYTNLTKERNSLQQKVEELERGLNLSWRYFNSSIYYMSTGKLNWSNSRQDCKRKGADLVSINSEQEQNFIKELKQNTWVWIGLNDRDAEGQWKWVDGTQLTTKHWEPGEPGGSSSENCALFRELWHDYTCSQLHGWICEKRT